MRRAEVGLLTPIDSLTTQKRLYTYYIPQGSDMAVVKAPALSIDASGNVGGICYSKWRGMNIARGTWKGTVPNTTKQQIIQGYMTTVSQAWSITLSQAERDVWNLVASSLIRKSRGMVEYVPKGYQYFVELNIQRQRHAQPILHLPPSYQMIEAVEGFTVGWDGLFLAVRTEWTIMHGAPADEFYEVWRAGPYSGGGRNPIGGEWRFQAWIQGLLEWLDYTTDPFSYYFYKLRVVDKFGRSGNYFRGKVLTL